MQPNIASSELYKYQTIFDNIIHLEYAHSKPPLIEIILTP